MESEDRRMMEIIPPKIDESKTRKMPANPYRDNMARHITKRKRRKGAHIGIVQEIFNKRKKRMNGSIGG